MNNEIIKIYLLNFDNSDDNDTSKLLSILGNAIYLGKINIIAMINNIMREYNIKTTHQRIAEHVYYAKIYDEYSKSLYNSTRTQTISFEDYIRKHPEFLDNYISKVQGEYHINKI